MTDHQNLEYWRTAQHLSRRQARWALYLANFDFHMVHKPGTVNTRVDPLSRLSSHSVTDAEDNKSRVVLKPEQFRIAATEALTAVGITVPPLEKHIRENSER